MRFFTMYRAPKMTGKIVDGECELKHGELGDYTTVEMSDNSDPKQIKDAVRGFACQVAILTIMDVMGVEHEEACDIFWRGQATRARGMVESLRVGMGSTMMTLTDPKTGDTVLSFSTEEEQIERSV